MLPQVILERRLHLTNNGIRERESKSHYVQVVKAALDRRRALAQQPAQDTEPAQETRTEPE